MVYLRFYAIVFILSLVLVINPKYLSGSREYCK